MYYMPAVPMHYMMHSAKGSTWKDHKYIKRINGTYYYPNSYKGGRHLDDSGGALSEEEQNEYDSAESNLDADDIEALAKEVIRGNFGNGQTRKDLLGQNYQKIQDRVNEILLGKSTSSGGEVSRTEEPVGKKKMVDVSKTTVAKGTAAINKAASNKTLAESVASLGKNVAYNLKSETERKKRTKY